MKIEHIAIWTRDLEKMKHFYMTYFNMDCNEMYENTKKQFTSYFLSFADSDTLIEIMHNPSVVEAIVNADVQLGLTHIAISLGSKEKVDELTEQLRADGHAVVGEPRLTGDGYYESVVLDVEGNRIEITE